MKVLLSFFLLCLGPWPGHADELPTAETVVEKALALKLDETRAWRKLLHFEKTFLGSFESQVDSPSFFLSMQGKTDPRAELQATIEKIWSTTNLKEELSVQCQFPARYLFIREKLGSQFLKWPDRECPRLFKYFKALRGVSVSLIFSSYYVNNPSSAFGHTLLRINKGHSSDSQRFELLDYGLNFAATAKDFNSLTYPVKGLFGFFHGNFTSMPYYYKVREYNDAESRDLWEYELSFSQQAVDRLIYHIWEMGPTWIDYWYLTENCSYFMLTLLEAAEPQIDLTSNLKKYVIPSDTIHAVAEVPGLVKFIKFRPSARSELYFRLKESTPIEIDLLQKSLNQKKLAIEVSSQSIESQAKILDAILNAIDYQYIRQIQQDSPEKTFKDEVLLARSRTAIVSPILRVPTPELETPDLGHPSRKAEISFDSQHVFLRHKFAHHELIDPIRGFPEYAQISFFDTEFGYDHKYQKLFLEKFTLFEVISLSPWDRFFKPTSWRLKVGFAKKYLQSCEECHFAEISGGPGVTLQLSQSPSIVAYLGLNASLNQPVLTRETQIQFGYGPNLIVKTRFTRQWIFLTDIFWRTEVKSDLRYNPEYLVATQWTSDQFLALQLGFIQNSLGNQTRLSFIGYY